MVAFGASLAFLSFLDRAAISQAAPFISRDLQLSPVQMGLIFSAFGLTYAGCEIPSGWICDRFGAHRLLTRIVLWWSLFTAATGWAWSFSSLFVARLLFGAGESGCFPAIARVFRTWLPLSERNVAEGIKAASARWGAAITPALMAALYSYFTWRQVFVLFGVVGVVWAVAFWHWYRDDPSDHPQVNYAERALLPAVPAHFHGAPISWRKLMHSRSCWALGLQWFCHYYGFYFYITWLPLYLYQSRGLDLRGVSLAAGLPLFAAGLGSLLAGWTLSLLTRRMGSVSRARKALGYAAYGGAAGLLLVFMRVADPAVAMLFLSLSSFAAEFSGPITWTTAMDIGGDRVSTVSAFMNMLGHFGGAVAPTVTGVLLAWSGNAWNLTFLVSASIYAAGAICWIYIDPVTPLDLDQSA